MRSRRCSLACLLLVAAASSLLARQLGAQEPLHRRIDGLLNASYVTPPAGPAAEATLVRRLYLDLTGRTPSADEVRQFLQSTAADKWPQLVDRLLADPRFVQRMVDFWDVTLMERRGDKHVKADQWRSYLEEAVAGNVPFDELAREILAADGRDPQQRGPAKFYLEREAEPNLLTRDIGRMFFGVDLQCAQCHDHPLIDDYYQADYYGLYAFVGRLSMFADKKQKVSYLSEKFDGEASFKSVFTDESGSTNPRLLWDDPVADDPKYAKGEEYQVKPDKNAAGVPKYSRRARLAEEVGKGENLAFRRNIANRLWALMMGRGLVHPVDLHHSGNPPAHPQLLDLLAAEIAAMDFDTRAFIRQIALSEAYRRDFSLPESWHQRAAEVAAEREPWEAARRRADAEAEQAESRRETAFDQFNAASEAKQKADAAAAPLAAAEQQQKSAADAARAAASEAEMQMAASAQRLAPLDEALQAAAAAAQALGDGSPPQLAEALAVLQAKRAAAAGQLASMTAAVGDKQAAALAADSQWEQARQLAAPARGAAAERAKELDAAKQAYAAAEADIRRAQRAAAAWQRRLDESRLLLSAAETPLPGEVEALREQWSRRFAMTGLQPLTPEQLCWSMLEATGQIRIQRAAAAAALKKKSPLSEADRQVPAKVAARQQQIDDQARAKLAAHVAAFVKLFAAGAGQPQDGFFATADQALFFRNGSQIRSWIGSGGDSLYQQLMKLEDPSQLADRLYLSVLSRPPQPEERDDVIGYLQSRQEDRGAAVQEMIWALLTSIEFRFRH